MAVGWWWYINFLKAFKGLSKTYKNRSGRSGKSACSKKGEKRLFRFWDFCRCGRSETVWMVLIWWDWWDAEVKTTENSAEATWTKGEATGNRSPMLVIRFLKAALLRYNSRTRQITWVQCAIQWFSVFSQTCDQYHNFRTCAIISKGSPVLSSRHPPFSNLPSPKQPLLCLPSVGTSLCWTSRWMESHNTWSLVSSFFHLASRFQGSWAVEIWMAFKTTFPSSVGSSGRFLSSSGQVPEPLAL